MNPTKLMPGQRWRHPEVGYRFSPGVAILQREIASDGRPGWEYEAEDGTRGFIPTGDLVERGELEASES